MEKQDQEIGEAFIRKTPILLILLLVCIIGATIGFYHLTEKNITIVDGNKEFNIKTRSKTIEEVFIEEKVSLKPEDIVEPSLDTPIENGLEIQINRAKPITIISDGKEYEIITATKKVGDIIREAGIALGNIDKVLPYRESDIGNNKDIRIIRVTEEKVDKEEKIEYAIQRLPTKELDKGETKVVQRGETGLRNKEIKVTYEDGKETRREIIKEEVIIKPRDEIIQVGVNDTITTSRGNTRFEKAMIVTATAYCYGEPGVNNTTSVGARLKRGVIAVDPKVIPYYTKLYVPGYGFGQALDTGGAIKGNKIDLAMDTKAETIKYGRRKIKIYILGK